MRHMIPQRYNTSHHQRSSPKLRSITPLIPLGLPNHRFQRPLKRQHLALDTLRKRNLMLVLQIKRIVARTQRVFQIPHMTSRMQFLPGAGTGPAFAALEREQQSVEAGCKGVDGPRVDCAVRVVKVGELVGVRLYGVLVYRQFSFDGRYRKGEGRRTLISYSSCSFVHHTVYAKSYSSPITLTVLYVLFGNEGFPYSVFPSTR